MALSHNLTGLWNAEWAISGQHSQALETPAGLPTWEPDNRTCGWALEISDVGTGRTGLMTACLNAFITALNIVGQKK